MHVRQGHEGRQLLQEFEWREANARGAVGPRMREGVDQIAVGVFLEALQGYRTSGGIADELFQLISPVRGDSGVGVERKAVDTGTVRTREPWCLALGAKARADAAYMLASSFTERDALLHGSGHGAGELRGGLAQEVIPGGHRGLHTCVQIAQPAELADH